MVKKTLKKVIEECSAAVPMLTKLALEILLPELVTMEDGIYVLNNYCKEIFSELYRETFNEEVEIIDV